jgi:hypothetical protein
MSAISKRLVPCLLLAVVLTAGLCLPASGQVKSDEQAVQNEIQKARIFRETYPLISETDLYCDIYVQESRLSDTRIITAERSDEKILLSDADIVFINKGKKDGLEVGQVFLVVELGNRIGDYGFLAAKRGRASVIFLEDSRAAARVEKTCGRLMVGDFLVPFEEKESLLGKDLGYEPLAAPREAVGGSIIYLERDYNEIGSGYWAIIDVGEGGGINVGQQMTIFREIRKDLPRMGIGNAVVIDVGQKTATIKVLSCDDAVRPGYQVQVK